MKRIYLNVYTALLVIVIVGAGATFLILRAISQVNFQALAKQNQSLEQSIKATP